MFLTWVVGLTCILRKYLCLMSSLPLHCRKYKKKAGMETIAPEFPTCHCYEVAGGGCAVIVSETGSKPWPPPALCMSELAPDAAALHPSQPEPEQSCDPGALPTWLASCEMSPATPMVWMSSFKGKYGKASLSCKLSAAFLPPWIFWLLHCVFLCMVQLLWSPQMLQLYQ